ncbi:hypothetical protein SDC9_46809 [bioreactor metagenome]|uniref:HNH nuclease domain-containing protein n=1 Tax=bioreactor metagenome TaxID=1076179 RepID=A0A644WA13_9ZZZZ
MLTAAIDDLELLISNNQYCGLCLYNGGATNCARVDGRCDAKWNENEISLDLAEDKRIKNDYVIKGNTVEITLENTDRVALIDLDDLHKLHAMDAQVYACYYKEVDEYYAQITLHCGVKDGKAISKVIRLQDIIIGKENVPKGYKIDHANHNGLDDRKGNLRVIPARSNSRNRKGPNKNNKSGYRNVMWATKENRWVVTLMIDGKQKYFGRYKDVHEAGRVAKEMREKYYGEFAGEG